MTKLLAVTVPTKPTAPPKADRVAVQGGGRCSLFYRRARLVRDPPLALSVVHDLVNQRRGSSLAQQPAELDRDGWRH